MNFKKVLDVAKNTIINKWKIITIVSAGLFIIALITAIMWPKDLQENLNKQNDDIKDIKMIYFSVILHPERKLLAPRIQNNKEKKERKNVSPKGSIKSNYLWELINNIFGSN